MANNKDFKVKNGIQPTVYHEGVGTVVSGSVGYYLAGASYDSVSFSVASQDNIPTGLVFNTDGTKLYVGGTQNETIYQYTLSTAFDLSTASYDSVSFSVSGQESNLQGFIFSADGAKLFVVGGGSNTVYQYSLSTSFDLSTASYNSISFSVSGQDTQPYDVIFNSNGTKMYVAGNNTDTIYQYSLSSGFDLSTASYNSISFSVSGQDATPVGIRYNDNGTKLFMLGATNDSIYQYSLSTAFDLSTASYDSVSFSVASQSTAPQGLTSNGDGTKMYVIDAVGDSIYQYSTVLYTQTLDLSTGSVFEITPTSDIQINLSNPADSGTVSQATLLLDQAGVGSYDIENATYANKSFSVTSEEANPRGLFFKTDGTKMYVTGNGGQEVNEYNLSTAFDVSTSTYNQVFSVSSQDTYPMSLFFKSDGTKMYVLGNTNDAVYEYTLSTAWDISTSSYVQNFSVSSQNARPEGLFFKSDGTKMFVAGSDSTDNIYEYNLSAAFDLSTASYSQSFNTSSQTGGLVGVSFSTDGTQMFVLDDTGDDVNEYTLSTGWDVSTASYVRNFSVSSQTTSPQDVYFKPNGKVMYIIENGTDTVFQYTTSASATITYPSTLEFSGGTAPTSPAIGETDVITISTTDGGTSYQAVQAIDGAR